MSGTRFRIALAAIAVPLLAGGGLWWFVKGDRDPKSPAPGASRTEAQDQQNAAALIHGLPAAFAANDESALSSSLRAEGLDLTKAFPAGTVVEPNRSTWHRSGPIASMDATASAPGGGTARKFSVVMVFENGAWRISGTYAKVVS
jgi:hypothetical protein